MTTALGTSNLRGGPSRSTRTNPSRVSRVLGSSGLRQNSLAASSSLPPPPSVPTAAPTTHPARHNDAPGMYPAITHFADALAALPRDFRRHNSLLKEVDAKAWATEEHVQTLLRQCLIEADASLWTPRAAAPTGPTVNGAGRASSPSGVPAAPGDQTSLTDAAFADPSSLQRRQTFHALRQNLMTLMVAMDEKNHVINKANEELTRHLRRLDGIWPHIAQEISEEARLGSLKHWAYTETVPPKKSTAPAATARKEAAAGLAGLHDSEIAHRSEARREALLARKQRNAPNVDSDFDDLRGTAKKGPTTGKKRTADVGSDSAGVGAVSTGTAKRKKGEKAALGGLTMERSISTVLGSRPMSRDSSQQDHAKKRKASVAATTVARKRINAAAHDSPKLASSPLAGNAAKEPYKKSPALSTVRPATARGRQNSAQGVEAARGRPSSVISSRNGNTGPGAAGNAEQTSSGLSSVKSTNEGKNAPKDSNVDRALEGEPATVNGAAAHDYGPRGVHAVERSISRPGSTHADGLDEPVARAVASPRIPPALQLHDTRHERAGRGRASKTSTPVAGTFAEADDADSGSANGNGNGHGAKGKRPSRPRMKDHGLHDSLSPKGLPMKRSHKKGASISAMPAPSTTAAQRLKDEHDVPTLYSPSEDPVALHEGDDDDDRELGEDDEERYCYCQGVSYGEMVACDKPDCPRQWFHLECIGLKSVPKSAKWYCDECKDTLAKKGKLAGNGGNGNGK